MINLDFTINKYKELCNAISNSGYIPLTVNDYLSKSHPDKFIILRHDVDIKPERALKISQIENEFNIKSTYYFRMIPKVFNPEIITKIQELGHEIGFHYEVLDKAKGNYGKAISIFKEELAELRNVCEIKTICMHGYPLTPWKNSDIWNQYEFKDFGIIGEAYLSIDYNDVSYLSDTGRSWSGEKYRIKDIIESKNKKSYNIKSTDDLIRLIKEERFEHLCVLSHPGQWTDNYCSWASTLITRNVKNIVKAYIIPKIHKS